MKQTLEEVKKQIGQHDAEIRRRFKINEIYVFGSVVRGEMNEQSDIDVFVVFENAATPTLFDLSNLSFYLEELLQTTVDLGTKNSLHPALKNQILKEAVRVA